MKNIACYKLTIHDFKGEILLKNVILLKCHITIDINVQILK